jgi:hypothetical protein
MLARDTLAEVAQLPTRQQDALVQMAIEGRSRTEVAASMGLSEGAVRQLVHRARATVRSAVTAITPFPLARWLAGGRSGSAAGLSDATVGAATASGAGIGLKLGVGALVTSGVLATSVISTVSPAHQAHQRSHTRLLATLSTSNGGVRSALNKPTVGAATSPAARRSTPEATSRAQQSSGTRSGSPVSPPRRVIVGRPVGGPLSGRGAAKAGATSGSGSSSPSYGGSDGSRGEGGVVRGSTSAGRDGGSDGGTSGPSASPARSDGSDGGSSGPTTSTSDGGSSGSSDGGSSGPTTSTSDGGSSGSSDGGSGSAGH